MKMPVLFVFAVVLFGCAGNTGIVKISDDTYMLGRQSSWHLSGSVVKKELYKEGNEFCAAMNKKFIPVSDNHADFSKHYSTSSLAGAEIKFKCE